MSVGALCSFARGFPAVICWYVSRKHINCINRHILAMKETRGLPGCTGSPPAEAQTWVGRSGLLSEGRAVWTCPSGAVCERLELAKLEPLSPFQGDSRMVPPAGAKVTQTNTAVPHPCTRCNLYPHQSPRGESWFATATLPVQGDGADCSPRACTPALANVFYHGLTMPL